MRLLPLRISGNAVELLLKLQDLLTRSERQMSVEMRLVANLLDASRIEANKFELSPVWCNLVEVVRETVASQQELTSQRRFELEMPRDDFVAVIADVDRIKQALTNYLANAVKFSHADQLITVSLRVSNGLARVSVQDKGPGIVATDQSRVWEGFQQGQRRSGEARGGWDWDCISPEQSSSATVARWGSIVTAAKEQPSGLLSPWPTKASVIANTSPESSLNGAPLIQTHGNERCIFASFM